jgi:cell division protein FtsI (penicillin-binding protein 3)
MAAAFAAVANGGTWLTPHLVDRVVRGPRTRVQSRRVLSPVVARKVRAMLSGAVSDGTGTLASVPGYTVAGKTGTAAKPDPVNGGYSTSNYVASFVGMVPASKPRLVILVSIDEPRGAIWGGVVAAPVFREIADFALQYLEVAPDDPTSLTAPALP